MLCRLFLLPLTQSGSAWLSRWCFILPSARAQDAKASRHPPHSLLQRACAEWVGRSPTLARPRGGQSPHPRLSSPPSRAGRAGCPQLSSGPTTRPGRPARKPPHPHAAWGLWKREKVGAGARLAGVTNLDFRSAAGSCRPGRRCPHELDTDSKGTYIQFASSSLTMQARMRAGLPGGYALQISALGRRATVLAMAAASPCCVCRHPLPCPPLPCLRSAKPRWLSTAGAWSAALQVQLAR